MEGMKMIPELLKLPVKIITALCIASGLILFLPNNIINKLYMINFKNSYGFVIGIIFVITLSIVACYLIFYLAPIIWNKLTHKHKTKKIKARRKEIMDNLNDNEREIINELMKQPDNTLELPFNTGIVKKLTYYNIISPTSSENYVDLFEPIIPYFLQPWVFDYINEKNNK